MILENEIFNCIRNSQPNDDSQRYGTMGAILVEKFLFLVYIQHRLQILQDPSERLPHSASGRVILLVIVTIVTNY